MAVTMPANLADAYMIHISYNLKVSSGLVNGKGFAVGRKRWNERGEVVGRRKGGGGKQLQGILYFHFTFTRCSSNRFANAASESVLAFTPALVAAKVPSDEADWS